MKILTEDILTLDNLAHFGIGLTILIAAVFYPPLAAGLMLYYREQTQVRERGFWPSVKLIGSFHKWAEVIVPTIGVVIVWEVAWPWLFR